MSLPDVLSTLGEVARLTTFSMTPLLLAAVGEIIAELAGIVNIGLEGIMLLAGFAAVAAAEPFGPLAGLLAGLGTGLLLGLVHGWISVYLKGDQIISGLGINIFALGFVAFGIEALWGVRGYYTPPPEAKVPRIPSLGISPTFLLAVAITIASYYVLYRTSLGLKIRAVGERPDAADSVGVHVERVQLGAAVVGAALAGLAGAFLSIDWLAAITKELPAGRGFIALAIVNFANWNPLLALGGSALFGFFWTLGEWVKNIGTVKALVPIPLLNTIPYVATLIVTAGLIGRSRPPAHIGRPYRRE
ncbi:MAG: ABC transporter permease [Thermoproteota archaeon]